MTSDSLPTGPDPEAITDTILETWPETDMVEALGARFFSLDPEKHWPNFATIVTTDEHDEGTPSTCRGRRLPPEHRRRQATFERLVGSISEPDHAALDRIAPPPRLRQAALGRDPQPEPPTRSTTS